MAYEQHARDAGQIAVGFALVTLSDTRTPDTDTSGQALRRLIDDAGHQVMRYDLIPDDPDQLRAVVDSIACIDRIDCIVCSGGTGFSPRDRTIDTLAGLFDVPIPGFGELFRHLSFGQIGSGAMLSRATAGIVRGRPVFALPGSTPAVTLATTALILPEIRHLLSQIRKG
jgi:molybdopterin adenylyltransferase